MISKSCFILEFDSKLRFSLFFACVSITTFATSRYGISPRNILETLHLTFEFHSCILQSVFVFIFIKTYASYTRPSGQNRSRHCYNLFRVFFLQHSVWSIARYTIAEYFYRPFALDRVIFITFYVRSRKTKNYCVSSSPWRKTFEV